MPLSTLFTDEEVEYVREMAKRPNTDSVVAEIVAKLDTFSAALVIATQRDIEAWKRIEYGTEKSKGGIKGTDYDVERNRRYITDKIRERLALPALPQTLGPNDMGIISFGIGSFGTAEETDDEYGELYSGTSDW
jgi:hypothetical protein